MKIKKVGMLLFYICSSCCASANACFTVESALASVLTPICSNKFKLEIWNIALVTLKKNPRGYNQCIKGVQIPFELSTIIHNNLQRTYAQIAGIEEDWLLHVSLPSIQGCDSNDTKLKKAKNAYESERIRLDHLLQQVKEEDADKNIVEQVVEEICQKALYFIVLKQSDNNSASLFRPAPGGEYNNMMTQPTTYNSTGDDGYNNMHYLPLIYDKEESNDNYNTINNG